MHLWAPCVAFPTYGAHPHSATVRSVTLEVGTVLSLGPKALLHHRKVLLAIVIKALNMTFGRYQVYFF